MQQQRRPKQKNEAIQKALGERIRELRSKRGWSQEEFADVCGLHRTYMGSIERGERNMTIVSVLIVAKHLGLTMSQLLSGLEKRATLSGVQG